MNSILMKAYQLEYKNDFALLVTSETFHAPLLQQHSILFKDTLSWTNPLYANRSCNLLLKGKKLSHHLPPDNLMHLFFSSHIRKQQKR